MFIELALVVAITDGDTIKVFDGQEQKKIRLASIDAPERKQPFGMKSKQMLTDLLAGKRVSLDCPSVDRYKRLICTIWLDGEDVNRAMVSNGGAWVYRKYYKGTDYLAVEREATSAAVGLWGISEYKAIPPWDWRKGKRS